MAGGVGDGCEKWNSKTVEKWAVIAWKIIKEWRWGVLYRKQLNAAIA